MFPSREPYYKFPNEYLKCSLTGTQTKDFIIKIRRPLLPRGHQAVNKYGFDFLPSHHIHIDPHIHINLQPSVSCLVPPSPPGHAKTVVRTRGRPRCLTFPAHGTPQTAWDIPQKPARTPQNGWQVLQIEFSRPSCLNFIRLSPQDPDYDSNLPPS
jgi:hypothetical protein